jgi:hypothetical protein
MTKARLAALLLPFLILLPTAVLPPIALACDCAMRTVADLEPDAIVVVGQLGERTGESRPVLVERWYSGAGMTDVLPIAFDEDDDGASCGITVTTGERLFLVPDQEGVTLGANLCTLQAPADSEAGQELITAATTRYGPGAVPARGTAPPELPEAPASAAGLVVVAAMVGVSVAALFGGLLLFARRGRSDRV